MSDIITVRNLTKRYSSVIAVDDVSFSVSNGEVFGLLGPNGAGKTTTVEILESLRKPDSGSVFIDGLDVLSQAVAMKEIIGVQLQSTTLYEKARVYELLELFGLYFQKSIGVDKLLEDVSLADKRESYVKNLSGGQKQRVALALALVNDPKILFLDEPTTGLDPQARQNVWGIIENLRDSGKTIMLTTHYMEEAEKLCDRVGIMDRGKIITIGAPAQLVKETGLDSAVEFSCPPEQADAILNSLKNIKRISSSDGRYTVFTNKPSAVLQQIASLANRENILLDGLSLKRANLEDVFIELTGRKLRE